jgi:ribosomal protein RSM22 (predicted rRNA methylase)
MKMYPGNEPDTDDGWEYLQSFKDDCVVWLVFEKKQGHSEHWFNYKIVADGFAPLKANYWCAFNKKTKRSAFNKDLAVLKQHRPKLYDMFMDTFAD